MPVISVQGQNDLMRISPIYTVLAVGVALIFSSCQTSGSASSDNGSSAETSELSSRSMALVSLNWSQDERDYSLEVEVLHPISHHNLQVFPLRSSASITERTYVTLEKALAEGMAIMKETSNVNELMLNNKSDEYIYVQSGDIVKGGKQDRTMQHDLVVAPGDKKVPVASFCVESGRWTNRGNEDAGHFSAAPAALSAKELKLATKKEKDQSRVWSYVSSNQDKLSKNVSEFYDTTITVNNAVSYSSYQLALENEDLDSLRKVYLKDLEAARNGADICGFAYAINGQFYGLDLYNNKMLFDDLTNKMLESFVTEAIAVRDSFKYELANVSDVQKILTLHMNKELAESSERVKLNKVTEFETID